MITLFLIALSVSADATAVAIAASIRGISAMRGFLLASLFGSAQALMAAAGWFGGERLGAQWAAWDHWIALLLLTGVGLKMIREAMSESEREPLLSNFAAMLMLAVATSVDSLAVGISLPGVGVPLTQSLAMIGTVTFLLSLAGCFLGRFLGSRFGRGVEIAGGLLLIGIGITIALEHGS